MVEAGAHTLQAMLLMDGLAVRRGLALVASASPWSSAPHRLGLRRDPLVTDPPGSGAWATRRSSAKPPTPRCWPKGWATRRRRRIEQAAASGWALGSPQYLADIEQQLGRPVRPRARGRPPRRTGGG